MGPIQGIDLVTLVVEDIDEAIEFYVDTLGLELYQDEAYGDGDRWVEVRPAGSRTKLVLKTPAQFDESEARHHRELIGTTPMVTFRVDDCCRCYDALREAGVRFDGEPESRPWGTTAVARDPSGNPVVLTGDSRD